MPGSYRRGGRAGSVCCRSAAGTPIWFDSFFMALWRAEADARTGRSVSPFFAPLMGLYNPVVRSGFAVAVMFTIIGVGVVVMILALARRFSRWQLPRA